MSELRHQRVLIVIAVAGNHLPFFVEMPDFAELQRHPASRGLQGTERPVVYAFAIELRDDDVPGVNVLGVDSAVRKGLGPILRPLPKLIACLT